MPSSNIGPLIKGMVGSIAKVSSQTRHLRAFPRDFVISTRFICPRLFIWDVDVFNKGNSSVKFDLLLPFAASRTARTWRCLTSPFPLCPLLTSQCTATQWNMKRQRCRRAEWNYNIITDFRFANVYTYIYISIGRMKRKEEAKEVAYFK